MRTGESRVSKTIEKHPLAIQADNFPAFFFIFFTLSFWHIVRH